jgi:methionine synthase I (cobalamin-dependent)
LITDGAWGTELQRLGLLPSECGDAWNLQYPERVEAVARGYVEAGSQVILTNTFRANATALAAYGLADQVQSINRAGVAISKRAAEGRARVFGCIGPAASDYKEQAAALARAGVEALVIETMTDIDEAGRAAISAKRTSLPVIVSFSFGSADLPVEDAARAMADLEVYAVGANCGNGIDDIAAICTRLRAACDLPLWIKPSAGLPRREGDRLIYEVTPRRFACALASAMAAGAGFAGGCCGTTPEYIREIRRLV